MRRYSPRFRCLTFDQHGTGRSSHVPVRSVEQMAGDLAAVLDHAGLPSAHLLGHSTGSAINVAMALEHPSRLTSLIIQSSTSHGDAYRRRLFEVRRALGPEAYARLTTLLLYPPCFINANDAALRNEETRAAAALASPEVQGFYPHHFGRRYPQIVAVADWPTDKSSGGLLAALRAKGEPAAFGSSGNGSPTHRREWWRTVRMHHFGHGRTGLERCLRDPAGNYPGDP